MKQQYVFSLRLNRDINPEVKQWLDCQSNKTASVISLIEKCIEQNGFVDINPSISYKSPYMVNLSGNPNPKVETTGKTMELEIQKQQEASADEVSTDENVIADSEHPVPEFPMDEMEKLF